jgi:hypothetical protein
MPPAGPDGPNIFVRDLRTKTQTLDYARSSEHGAERSHRRQHQQCWTIFSPRYQPLSDKVTSISRVEAEAGEPPRSEELSHTTVPRRRPRRPHGQGSRPTPCITDPPAKLLPRPPLRGHIRSAQVYGPCPNINFTND